MAVGKYLSLEEARKAGLLDRYAKEHPSEGDEAAFNRLLDAMALGKPSKDTQTSVRADRED
jgi:hypothetical protein